MVTLRNFKINDTFYKSITDFLEKENISAYDFGKAMKLFDNDLDKHMKAIHHLLEEKRVKSKEKINIWGYEFSTITKAAKYFNINAQTLHRRINELKLSPEKAVEKLLGKSKSEWKEQEEVDKLWNNLLTHGFCDLT